MSTRSSSLRDFQRTVVPIVGSIGALLNAATIGYFDWAGLYSDLGPLEPALTGLAAAVFVTSAAATAAMLLRSRVGHNLRLFVTVLHALVTGAAAVLIADLARAGAATLPVMFMWFGAVVVLAGVASTLIAE